LDFGLLVYLQDIHTNLSGGRQRSAGQLGFKKPDQERRKYVWWCIYSLDRTLSSALGRPLAIRDTDCDVEVPDGGCDNENAGFVSILRLRQVLGNILDTVAAVRKVKDNRVVSKIPEIRTIIVKLNTELQTWASKEVPQHIKNAEAGSRNVERLIALSGYFSALMLLYRYLVSNPHRSSALNGSEAVVQCARAATNCIRVTSQIVASFPICPDLIFHAQHVFTASMILLHCIRRSEDTKFIQVALKDIEVAGRSLRDLQKVWGGAKNLACFLEEYLEFILKCLERGLNFQDCAFHHEEHEVTGLEWRLDTEQNTPVNWSDFDFANLVMSSGGTFDALTTVGNIGSQEQGLYQPAHAGVGGIYKDNALQNDPPSIDPLSNRHRCADLDLWGLHLLAQERGSPSVTGSGGGRDAAGTPVSFADDNRSGAAHEDRHDPFRAWYAPKVDQSFDNMLASGLNGSL
jgi:hypothetical protein